MKCLYKRKQKECEKSAIYICNDCQTQFFYCKRHGDQHSAHTKHNIASIWSSGLSKFKKEIKTCINDIATKTEAVIAEIRRTSLRAIIQLKETNKNVNKIEMTS